MERTLTEEKQLLEIQNFVREILKNERTGHDVFHAQQVVKNAESIMTAENSKVDRFVVLASCWLHDIIDDKVTMDVPSAKENLREFLKTEVKVKEETIREIFQIIENISFSQNIEKAAELSLEGKIVQDADRLEALGAIGIARTFYYAGMKGDLLYDPQQLPRDFQTKAAYRQHQSTALNHFFEKLLKLPTHFQTTEGKKLAKQRELFMKNYLKTFIEECHLDNFADLLTKERE